MTKTNFKKWNELTPEEQQARKEAKKEKVNALSEELEKGVISVLDSKEYADYLKFMASFHNYSFNNSLLIYYQSKKLGFTASMVKGFQTWKKDGRFVKKGAKALQIFAPVPTKYKKEVENEDGTKEEKEVEYLSFKPTYVFDISQTEGVEVPHITNELLEKVDNFESLIKLLIQLSPCEVKFENIQEADAYGYYDSVNNYIAVKSGIGETQAVKTLIHEISHAVMHNRKIQGLENITKEDREIQAESVAYIISNYLGLETSGYSFGYVASYVGNKEKIENFQKNLKIIQFCANALIEKLEKIIEKGIAPTRAISEPLAKIEAPETITSVTVDNSNGQTSFKLNNRSTSSQLKLNNEWMKKAPKTTIKQICRKWKGATTENGLDILDFMQVFRPDCF